MTRHNAAQGAQDGPVATQQGSQAEETPAAATKAAVTAPKSATAEHAARGKARSKSRQVRTTRRRRPSRERPESFKDRPLGVLSILYMVVTGTIAFLIATVVGLRTVLALPEYGASPDAAYELSSPAAWLETSSTSVSTSASRWHSQIAAAGLVVLAVTLVLGLIFSFLLMETSKWRQHLAIRSVLFAYPLGIAHGFYNGRNICGAFALSDADCSGASVGLFLLGFVVMILLKMLYLIFKDVVWWEEIEV
ncbi:hypothetical protein KEM52_000627 [Ascosphaera acerosa]|nr:hypothetical protein KEM52_000627 [Ascosphaera acerosa]